MLLLKWWLWKLKFLKYGKSAYELLQAFADCRSRLRLHYVMGWHQSRRVLQFPGGRPQLARLIDPVILLRPTRGHGDLRVSPHVCYVRRQVFETSSVFYDVAMASGSPDL